MAKTAILAVRIIADAKGAQKGFDETATGVEKLGGTLDRLTPAAAGALAGITALAVKAGAAASEAQQAVGAVESVFGAYAGQVQKFADQAAENVGLAASQYNTLASVLGSQLKNMGIPMEAVAGQTDELIKLGADLAATFGGTTADAVGALSSLMRGERDPIERFGVSIKQADIEAQKAAMGLSGLTGEAAKNADTQATLALLYAQTADASGQFARETDSAAGAQQIATAKWEDASAKLGEVLLPLMTAGAQIAADFAGGLEDNATAVQILVGVIGGLALAVLVVNGALKAYEAMAKLVTAAQWLWNVAMDANPIGLIVIAIGLVIAIIVVLITHWDELSAAFTDFWEDTVAGLHDMAVWFQSVVDSITGWWEGLVDSFSNGFDQIIGWVQDVLDWFGKLGDTIGGFFGGNGWQWGGGGSFSAFAMAPDADSRMFALAAPQDNLLALPGANPMSSTASGDDAGTVINLTVNGAIDPDGTARTILDVLNTHARKTGARAAAGGVLSRA